jgi:methylglutaconyl-CoA hydratase
VWQAPGVTQPLVRYQATRGVATLTLDSSANRNALSATLLAELTAGIDTALADDAVRVLVLTHTGGVFCAGMDLTAAAGADPERQPVVAFPRVLEQIWTAPKPVLCRVAGKARAGGLGLVAACDIAVTSTAADFAFTEVRIGAVPAVISLPVLARMLPHAAHELFLTGEVFDGVRAAAVGLVNRAVPGDGLDAEVARYCAMLAAGAPGALAGAKRLLRRTPGPSMAADLAELAALSARHFAGPEGQEGIAAFREKRPASWVPDPPDSSSAR